MYACVASACTRSLPRNLLLACWRLRARAGRELAKQEELNATGVLRSQAWKLEWLDEYGYLVPEALEPGSAFLREHPHVIREWVFDSPSPIKWRGNSLNDSQVSQWLVEFG